MAAVLAALIARDRGAGAQLIEVSQFESTTSILGPALLEYGETGENPRRMGNRSPRACPHNVYPCAGEDRWCAIAVSTEAQWAALCEVLNRPEWGTDPRFASEAGRRQHEEGLDELVSEETRRWEMSELADTLQARGVPAAPVNTVADLLADPWYRDEYFSEQDGPEGCRFTAHGEPIRPFSAKHPVRRAPMLGEHTEDVLGSLLGLFDTEIGRLYATGVLG
jgi:benzylsuccinate CoA-transferase BbsF subunit